MRILQLCCFSNHWPVSFHVDSVDVRFGQNVLDLADNVGQYYDFVLAAPPCTQFTKANHQNWEIVPGTDIEIVEKCLQICLKSKKPFVLENPPGRIEKLIPGLKQYRQITLNDINTNKEWVLYSNILLIRPDTPRYGRKSISNLSLIKRLEYPPYFIEYLLNSICCEYN